MRTILVSLTLTFLFSPVFAQEDTDDEKVIKVEIVKDTSFEKAEVYGGNEIRVNFLDLLTAYKMRDLRTETHGLYFDYPPFWHLPRLLFCPY